jgi:hypothetical protein
MNNDPETLCFIKVSAEVSKLISGRAVRIAAIVFPRSVLLLVNKLRDVHTA